GKDKDRLWQVGVRDPFVEENVVDTLRLSNEAVATSGSYEQFFQYQGKRYSHIVDPKSGYPAQNGVVSVTVVTKNCTSADALATAFFVMGPDKIKQFVTRVSSSMKIFVISEDETGKKYHIF
ncbi:MAG: FAD:protein FMN transferase, partial [Candidatus Omnitrophota bacterium]